MSRPVITKDGDKIEQLPGGTVRTGSATPTEIAERKVEDKALADAAKFKKFNDAVVAENKARVLARHRAHQKAATKRLAPGVEDLTSGNQRITKETKPS